MNNAEAFLLITKIKTIYPRYYFSQTDLQLKMAAESWAEILHDIDVKISFKILLRYASNNVYPPTPKDFRDDYNNLIGNKISTDEEAWTLALKIAKSNYLGPGVQIDKLEFYGANEEIIKAVKAVGYESIFMSQNISIERSQFLRIYKQLAERKQKDQQLPKILRENEIKKLLPNQPNQKQQLETKKETTKTKANCVDFNRKLQKVQEAKALILSKSM